MVLKKSNTVLNSGATQRVTNNHVFYVTRQYIDFTQVQVNQINWLLMRQRSSPPYVDQTTVDILDFFAREFGCEELSCLTREVHEWSSCPPRGNYMLMSMNKKKRWLLPGLLENLILELHNQSTCHSSGALDNLLASGLEDTVKSLKIKIDDRNASICGQNKILTLYTVDQKNKRNSGITENFEEKSSDKTKTPHFRGIQRPYECTVKTVSKKKKRLEEKKRADETTNMKMEYRNGAINNRWWNKNAPALFVDVVRNFQNDSRAATVKTQLKKWELRPYNAPCVALSKGKHSVKGCRYGPRVVTHADLKREYEDAEDSIWNEGFRDCSRTNVFVTQGNHEPHVRLTANPNNEINQVPVQSQTHSQHDDNNIHTTFTLKDFVIENKMTCRKRRRRPSLSNSWEILPDLDSLLSLSPFEL